MNLAVSQLPAKISESLSALTNSSEVTLETHEAAVKKLVAYERTLGITTKPSDTIGARVAAVRHQAEQEVLQLLPAPLTEEQRSSLSLQDIEQQIPNLTAAIEKATQLQTILNEEFFQQQLAEVKNLLGKRFYGPEVCSEFFETKELGEVPEMPQWITPELLQGKCPWSREDKSVAETHSLYFIPAQVGQTVVSVMSFLKEGDERALEKSGKEIFRYASWYHEDSERRRIFGETKAQGEWVLVYEGAIPVEKYVSNPSYEGVGVRQLILSRAISIIGANGKIEDVPERFKGYSPRDIRTDRGSQRCVYCDLLIEGDGMSSGYSDSVPETGFVLARIGK